MVLNKLWEPNYPDLSAVPAEVLKEYLIEFTNCDDGWTTEQLFVIQRFMEDMQKFAESY
jgi:hypothetical protein